MYGVPIPRIPGPFGAEKPGTSRRCSEQGRGDHCKPAPAETVPRSAPGLPCWNITMNTPMASCDLPRARNPGDFAAGRALSAPHAGHESFYPPTTGARVFLVVQRGHPRLHIRNPFASRKSPISSRADNEHDGFLRRWNSHPEGRAKILRVHQVIQTNTSKSTIGSHLQPDRAGHGDAHHPPHGARRAVAAK